MKPIRVLHILQRMEAAGVQTLLMNIYRVIDRDKIQFDFLVQYKEKQFYDDEIRSLGGRIYKFSVREDYNIVKYRQELRCFFAKNKEYQIVHGHMETLCNIWEKEAKRAQLPTIIVHAHTAGFNEKNPIKLAVKEYFRKCYGHYASKKFACSKAAGNFMFSDGQYDIIPNAIDINKFRFSIYKRMQTRNELGFKNEFVIGHIGRFHPEKNHVFILEIAEKLRLIMPNAKVMLIGDGELWEQVKAEISKRKLNDMVLLLGNREDVHRLYSAMDAFVMPSLYEGLPLSGVEAQASGLPCFFSDSITDELKITDSVQFLSLNSGAGYWAELIAKAADKKKNRENDGNTVLDAGYDIHVLANRLSDIYISSWKGGQ